MVLVVFDLFFKGGSSEHGDEIESPVFECVFELIVLLLFLIVVLYFFVKVIILFIIILSPENLNTISRIFWLPKTYNIEMKIEQITLFASEVGT